MRIGQGVSFKGTFYAVSDVHTRLPMSAGVLTEIEQRAKKETEPVFLLEGGDFSGDTYPLKTMCDIYLNFHRRNPQINCIFNLGNAELEEGFINKNKTFEKCPEALKKLSENGINVVNATFFKVFPNTNRIYDFIKPYMTIEDVVDGEKKKLLVTGFTQRKIDYEKDINDTKEILKEIIKPAIEKENPDEIILMMHTHTNYTKDILDYAKNELGIKNIKFVSGAHPHSIEDFQHDETRVLYPAPNGKCAYEVKHTKNGFEFPKLNLLANHYNYAPLSQNKSVILNTDIDNPLPVSCVYQQSIDEIKNMNDCVAKSMFTFKTRNEYNFTYSGTSELGTFMANSIKNATGADIGIMLTQDFREKLPKKGKNITGYNVYDVVNVDKQVYKLTDVSVKNLKDIFEISLQKQNEGERNPDFFEYSSNIKIDRRITDEDNKIVQIYVKEGNEWVELLDFDGNPTDETKKFTIATCEFIANGGRKSLEYFKKLKSEPLGELKTRDMVIKSLQKLQNEALTEYKESVMRTVL